MTETARYRIDVAYDGTDYAGWQFQTNGKSVQEVIEKAIAQITCVNSRVHGSGRTDQGVHARGQVAHFDTTAEFKTASLRRSLNALLPPDVRINRVTRVASDFHARISAQCKEYRYFIWNGDMVPPFVRLYRTHIPAPLDVDAMQQAADILCDRHDFSAFTANSKRVVESNVRHLMELTVTRRGREIVIRAVGDGFLYKMVRSLAGWLIRVGDGSVPVERTREVLASRRRTERVLTARPEGLFLWRVKY